MDAFSEILRAVRLSGSFFVEGRFQAPWAYCSPRAEVLAPKLDPLAEKIVIFHLITHGECIIDRSPLEPIHLTAGHVVLFPHGDEHMMASARGLIPSAGVEKILLNSPGLIEIGGRGAPTNLLCGYMAIDRRIAQLLPGSLPSVVCVDVRASHAGTWIESAVLYALREARSGRPGSEDLLARMAELLFVEVLRLYLQNPPAEMSGWLAAAGDISVGAALKAIHTDPAQNWTLASLAMHAGCSRSILAQRFHALLGITTMRYLSQWRLALAANSLSTGSASVARIAEEVGYGTDTAFIRAFRREYGMPPAAWRKARSGGAYGKQTAVTTPTPGSLESGPLDLRSRLESLDGGVECPPRSRAH